MRKRGLLFLMEVVSRSREDGDRREGLSAAAAEFHTGEEERREEEKRSSKVAALTRGHGRSMVQCSIYHEGTADASRLERGKEKRWR